MNDLLKTVFAMLLRLAMLVAGLIFLASILAMALVLLGVWLLRALWAKFTGQPVNPWMFQVNRQAMWDRFYRPPGQRPGQGAAHRREDKDVVDVEPKVMEPPRA